MINKQAFFRIWQKLFGTTKKKAEMFAERAVISLAVSRNVAMALGNEKKNEFSFCISLIFS
jgi:hypothetical protein